MLHPFPSSGDAFSFCLLPRKRQNGKIGDALLPKGWTARRLPPHYDPDPPFPKAGGKQALQPGEDELSFSSRVRSAEAG